jgi:hypothetical protein
VIPSSPFPPFVVVELIPPVIKGEIEDDNITLAGVTVLVAVSLLPPVVP